MIILLGTKGQLIKMASVMWELDKRKIDYKYVQTNQHPEINLHLNATLLKRNADWNLRHDWNAFYPDWSDLVSFKDVIKWLRLCIYNTLIYRKEFKKHKLLVIHGDTMSTLLGLIIGKLFHLKIAHIESGYRSYSLLHPFPEEIINRLAYKFSDILFAPSKWAYDNLKNERGKRINTYQNTVYDVLKTIVFKDKYRRPYIVATIRRQETLYNHNLLIKVIYVIQKAKELAHVKFILHPLTEERLKYYRMLEDLLMWGNIELLPIQEYTEFMNLIANSEFVITDGGGLQEETYFLDKPCLLLRKRTERQVGLGETAYLSEFDYEKIDYFFEHWQEFKRKREFIHKSPSKIIVDYLEKEV